MTELEQRLTNEFGKLAEQYAQEQKRKAGHRWDRVEGRIESLIQGRVRSRNRGVRIGNVGRGNRRSQEEKTRRVGAHS